ncbi:MAG: hypothetical protein DME11_16230 [Candidatus Rokuibacteriota bacterium]|nr:MAG: hypothetical protein DME11_16230 [Candidatus Rokubacteria bacterium]
MRSTAGERAPVPKGTLDDFVCPDCKAPLADLRCVACAREYRQVDGFPILLSGDPRFEAVQATAAVYDEIYRRQQGVWENQGRTRELIAYFATLLTRFPSGRFLEIGCGEGFLLTAVRAEERFATDLSVEALRAARARTAARFSVALGERLPFPDESFDLVASVGVMEHFFDIGEALRETRRVLRPGGHCIVLTHVELTLWERLEDKISAYLFPELRLRALARWLQTRLIERPRPAALVRQPIQNRYTTRAARVMLETNGLEVVDVLHTRRRKGLPLVGPWVVIYIARK